MPILKVTQSSAPVFYPKKDLVLVKYLDLTKFLSLLQKRKLFFCRLDKLEDQFEGTTAKGNFEIRKAWYEHANYYLQTPLTEKEIIQKVEEYYQYEQKVKEVTCVCCWNSGGEESAALWKIYSDYGKGLLIKSSVSKMENSFANTQENIKLSEIKYINYETDIMNDGNTMYPLLHKQRAYLYENEVRLIYEAGEPQIGRDFDWSKEEILEGKLLTVDIDILIDEIIIGPFAPKWTLELISDLASKYGLNKPIKKSGLSVN